MLSGALLVNKEIGRTSRQEANYVSDLLGERKVGHIGTLDPFADGLLVMLFGNATKIAPFIEDEDKTYIATLKLGAQTDTADKDGEITETKEVQEISALQIKEVLKTFLGKQRQKPPHYSAIRINGQRAYDLARKNIDFELKERDVEIFDIQLLSQTAKDEFIFMARVSKGTYIRTLGEDIAKKLGTLGYLTALTRVAIGKHTLEHAHKAKDCKVEHLISISDMLSSYQTFTLNDQDAKCALNGMRLKLKDATDNLVVIKDKNGIIAMYEKEQGIVYRCKRGLR